MHDHRRSRRKRVQSAIQVFDALSDKPIGYVGNLSSEGMLLIGNRALRADALFQFTFLITNTATRKTHRAEIGVHEQWSEPANVEGQYWAGFRIIDISPDDQKVLDDWMNSPGGQFA
jgi:hypothetical protein